MQEVSNLTGNQGRGRALGRQGLAIRARLGLMLLACLLLAGCTTTPTVNMYQEGLPEGQVASLYNPSKFIQKVDNRTLYKNAFFDPNAVVELVNVAPGDHVLRGLVYSDSTQYGLTTYYKEWKFDFRMSTEAGHTYYIYYELVGATPAIFVRDLGTGFKPIVGQYADAWRRKSPERQQSDEAYYQRLKSEGVPVPIQLLPR